MKTRLDLNVTFEKLEFLFRSLIPSRSINEKNQTGISNEIPSTVFAASP